MQTMVKKVSKSAMLAVFIINMTITNTTEVLYNCIPQSAALMNNFERGAFL